MSNSADDALAREKQQLQASVFVGEEGDDPSSPTMNMAAAYVLALFALAALIFAWRLDIPDSVFTAPGLLPVLTALSLLGMAVGLARRALKQGASLNIFAVQKRVVVPFLTDEENRRGLLLIVIIVIYVAAVDLMGFDLRLPMGAVTLRFGSYELFSIIALTGILKLFWRAGSLHCALVAVIWVMALASVFRYGFRILLPGSG